MGNICNLGLNAYTPELGEKKPVAQMECRRAHYGKHIYIDTPLELKGRGITLQKVYTGRDIFSSGKHTVGWRCYLVTNRAFEKLKEQYALSMEMFLD